MFITDTKLNWWKTTFNTYASQLPNAPQVCLVQAGDSTKVRGGRALGKKEAVLEVSEKHLHAFTQTATGDYLAARAVADAVQPPVRGTAWWWILGIVALTLAGAAAIRPGGLVHPDGTTLALLVGATVATVVAIIAVRATVHQRRNRFHATIQQATNLAGETAASTYASTAIDTHTTVLHSLLAGEPLTPRKRHSAFMATINRAQPVRS